MGSQLQSEKSVERIHPNAWRVQLRLQSLKKTNSKRKISPTCDVSNVQQEIERISFHLFFHCSHCVCCMMHWRRNTESRNDAIVGIRATYCTTQKCHHNLRFPDH